MEPLAISPGVVIHLTSQENYRHRFVGIVAFTDQAMFLADERFEKTLSEELEGMKADIAQGVREYRDELKDKRGSKR